MVALKAVKIQQSQGQEKAAIKTQELVLIRDHSKEKARYKVTGCAVKFKRDCA